MPAPGGALGLTFGGAAALIFLLESLYPLRRRLFARPLGTAARWLQLHTYGGAVACVLVLLHDGGAWPAGAFGRWLLGLTLWTAASGLSGVLLQKRLPPALASLPRDTPYEQIPDLVRALRDEATTLAQGGSEALTTLYRMEIEPSLAGPRPSWAYLRDLRSGRDARLAPLHRLAPLVGADDRHRLERLEAVLTDKLQLDARYSLQRALRYWLYVHTPPAFVLLVLIGAHVFAVWRY